MLCSTVVAVGSNVSSDIPIGSKVLVPISRQIDPQGTNIQLACYGIELKEEGELRFLIRQTDVNGIVENIADEID